MRGNSAGRRHFEFVKEARLESHNYFHQDKNNYNDKLSNKAQ